MTNKTGIDPAMQRKPARLTLLSLALVCLSVFASPPASTIATAIQDGNDATALNARGLQLYTAGKYEEAVNAYKEAIKLKEDYADAHHNLGDAYFQLNQFKEAIDAYKKAIRYQPNLPTAYNNMGTAYYKLGEHKKAIAAYKASIRLDPKGTLTYYNLAATYLERGDEKAALEQYKFLKTVDPELANKLYLLIYKPVASVFGPRGVRLNVIATDSQGSPVSELKVEDFEVMEEGQPQAISFFSSDQFPLVYGLTLDTSNSMRVALPLAIETSKAVIKNNLPGDETLLVRFIGSDKIETIQDFTSDQQALNDGLDDLYAEGGQSAILDAVFLSAQRVAQYKATNATYLRRAVILITDGDERASFYSLDGLLKFLNKIDVQVFVISLSQESPKSLKLNEYPAKGAVDLLKTLASETGGQAFFPKSESELPAVIKQMMSMIRTQYVIGYKPAGNVIPETYRRVNVTIVDKPGGDKRRAVTRAGYVASEK